MASEYRLNHPSWKPALRYRMCPHFTLWPLSFRVRLLVNRKTEEAVAVKVVDMSTAKDCMDNVKKEVCVHKMLSHPNIVRFYGHRSEGSIHYIFLEYCSGGELFDRIGESQGCVLCELVSGYLTDNWRMWLNSVTEPDVGMAEKEAHRFFQQLISGVVSSTFIYLLTYLYFFAKPTIKC